MMKDERQAGTKVQQRNKDEVPTSSPTCCNTNVSGSVICPQDIRLGNLVTDEFYDSFKTIIEVQSVNNKGINLEIEDDGNYPECASRWIEPYYRFDTLRAIPISEDLLLKIGAVKLEFKEFPSLNLKGLQINFVNGLWLEYVSRVEIKGLHFLQNIFYFRNSEELAVSVLTDR